MQREPTASGFRRIRRPDGPGVTVLIDGRRVTVASDDTAASAVLLAGAAPSRISAVSGAPRAPYCMMGVCFECLLEIDGMPLQQGCLVPVREGMRIRTARGQAR